MRFSQRIGKTPVQTQIQIESMDIELKSALWNCFHTHFLDKYTGPTETDVMLISLNSSESTHHWKLGNLEEFFRSLWNDFFKEPFSDLPNELKAVIRVLKEAFFRYEWYQVYDFIEFVAEANSPADVPGFVKQCNAVLERELSGYRFVGMQITPITDMYELKGIEEALKKSKRSKLSGVNQHLASALSKLSSRKNPDYRNSIKESISAVESIAQIIAGNPKAELGQALKIIEDKIGIHPALKKAYLAIYGYTSDADGIRHAMINESKCDFDDAKYMLVSCSAFVNYLIMKATKAGLKL